MNKFLVSVLLVGSIAFPTMAQAWTYVGNAGNVVLCKDTVMGFYDRFEMALRYKWDWKRAGVGRAYNSERPVEVSIAAAYLERIKNLSPALYTELNTYLSTFIEDANFVDGYLPSVVDDSGVVVLPEKDCTLELLIVQRPAKFPKKTYYTINKIYWDKLQAQDRAVAILHELIYRVILVRGKNPATSEGVRMVNEVILSAKTAEMSAEQFGDLLITYLGANYGKKMAQ
ncbi:hypothetical protein B9G69_012200 [Bdellovibrio sp. SKB1291214]|uniref:hypothetical protein n=1 Tax=Bdellovibrio sp. SKB1291214 TaxID=1732569 RepID=UPI000B515FD0|nr:hypothetical protein [Bdellovibrio sp. SKB1291214]UYL07807.1 hypothetical protein B9G69_012200 [Bdellovibrio sp. SKB1291214]